MLKWLLAPLGLFLCLSVEAATWYVRPSTDCANNGDGTAYACAASPGAAGAWRTGANVVYGASGVNTGDTLKVCNSWTTADADTAFGFIQADQASATIDGDCSANGGAAVATMDGGGSFDAAIRCDSPNCAGQTWKNIYAKNFDGKAFYFRNGFTATNTANFTATNLRCDDILGTDANTPACIQGWGVTATITSSSCSRVSDDCYHWEGAGLTLTDSYCKDPGYGSDSNLGDCAQAAIGPDNAYIARNYFDKVSIVSDTGAVTKQAIAVTDVGVADNATIEDNIVLLPTTGSATYLSKGIYTEIPNTIIQRNYVRGGYEGIFVAAAGGVVTSNISVLAELIAFNLSSAVSSGTHTFTHNVGARTGTCANLNGGASVTVNAYNNLMLGCTTGFTKGGSTTVNQSNNAGFNNTTNSAIGSLAVTADPLLVGGLVPDLAVTFKTLPGSPLRGAGLERNIGNVQDNGNRAFAHPPSIGAWEAASGDIATARTAASPRTAASARTAASTRTAR